MARATFPRREPAAADCHHARTLRPRAAGPGRGRVAFAGSCFRCTSSRCWTRLLRIGVLSPEVTYWGGSALALLLVCAWLLVYRRVLVEHDVKEERQELYRAPLLRCLPSWAWLPSLTGAFNLLSGDLLVFIATKLFAAVHCTQRASPSGTPSAATWHIGNGSGDTGVCYGTEHRAATLAAMLAMALYFPTAVLYGSAVLVRSEGRFADAESDVNFSADFAVVEKVLKIVLVGVSSFGSAFEGGTVTLCTALAESAVLLWLLQGRGGGKEACGNKTVRIVVSFEYGALAVVAGSGLLARWVWPDAPHAGTAMVAGWGVAFVIGAWRVARLRSERRSVAQVLQLGGENAKACYYENRLAPERVSALIGEEVTQAACGSGFTLALTRGGEVWSWGREAR